MSHKATVAVIVTFVLLVILAAAIPQCHAGEPAYTQISVGETLWRGPTEAAQLTFSVPANVLRNARWQGDLTFMNASRFNHVNYPIDSIVSGMFVDGFGHFDLGLGEAWIFDPAPYNGSHVNFALMAAYRFERLPITIAYRHWSNAGETTGNLGRDMITIGWRFR